MEASPAWMEQPEKVQSLLEIARSQIGTPAIKYVLPGTIGCTPEAFDCSGFVQWALTEAGIYIPRHPRTGKPLRHARGFFDHQGKLVMSPLRREGDLVFFSQNAAWPTHVGIYSGQNKMIHSPGRNEQFVEEITIAAYCKKRPQRYDPSCRHDRMYVKDPIGFKRVA